MARGKQGNNGANLGFEEKLWQAAEIEDDGVPFEEKMETLTSQLHKQFENSKELEQAIKDNLEVFGYGK